MVAQAAPIAMSDHAPAADLAWLDERRWRGCFFDGHWTAASSVTDVQEPATGRKLGEVGLASAEDIAAAAQSARAAQRAWSATSYDERARTLRAAAAIAEKNSEEIIDWIVRESGSIRAKAGYELAVSIKLLYEASAMPSQAAGSVLPSEGNRISVARRRPIGVVGVISPFNFPLYLAIRAVAPALAVGNAVVLKPDPRTAVCGGFSIARLFEEAGLPANVLHVLPGEREAGAALCSDQNVGMIQFTGSTAAGRKVGELAGKHLKKVSLELGGKNSLIVLDDADIDLAVRNAKWGAYLHQGQICMAAGRILVHEAIADRFVEALAGAADALPVGDPSTGQVALGPLISETQASNVKRIVDASVGDGADLAAGGAMDGLYFRPTVLTNVRKGMAAFDEEIFGPVAVVATFADDAEAIELANDTEFGLAAGVITNSIERALSMADKLRVGLLHINDQTVNEEVVNPFGGVGASGNGTSIGGPANWEEFTHWQWLTIKGAPPAYPL